MVHPREIIWHKLPCLTFEEVDDVPTWLAVVKHLGPFTNGHYPIWWLVPDRYAVTYTGHDYDVLYHEVVDDRHVSTMGDWKANEVQRAMEATLVVQKMEGDKFIEAYRKYSEIFDNY